MRDYADQAQQVTVAVNMNDSALRLSQLVNRASRAGRPEMGNSVPRRRGGCLRPRRISGLEILWVRPENIPDLSRRSHTFWYDDPWVSSDVLITLLYHLPPGERGLASDRAASGAEYWTFTPDYPDRLAAVMERLRQGGQVVPEEASH